MGGGMCPEQGAEPSCTVSREGRGSAARSRGVGVPVPGLMVSASAASPARLQLEKIFPI